MCSVEQHVATTTGEGEVNECLGSERDLSQGGKWRGDEGVKALLWSEPQTGAKRQLNVF